MIHRSSAVALSLVAVLASCSEGGSRESASKPSAAGSRRPSQGGGSQDERVTVLDEGLGILVTPDGSRFQTTLYELKLIGQLRTVRKLPYYILSGRGCTDCDANISIYIHSPSDGPMKGEGHQTRFAYPGREVSYPDGRPLYEARMFFGDCAPAHLNSVLWFQRTWGEDKRWHANVFRAQVIKDNLVDTELAGQVPTLAEALEAVRRGHCRELAGVERTSEP